MKTLLLGTLLSLISLSAFSQSNKWEHISHVAAVKTDLKFCFDRIIAGAESSHCDQEIQAALDVGVTKEQMMEQFKKAAKFKIIAEEAGRQTDEALKDKMQELVSTLEIEEAVNCNEDGR